MQVLGEGISYLVVDGLGYILGKLDHESFEELLGEDRKFSFIIDSREDYLSLDSLEKQEEFRNFRFPLDKVYDREGTGYPIEGPIDENLPIEGKMIVQKLVYRNLRPAGYIYFEFKLDRSERHEDYIRVLSSESRDHRVVLFD